MNIGRQWNDRLRLWAEQFPKHYYKAHAPLSLSYFTTMEQLPYGEAVKRAFVPAPTGMKWGRKWEYGWFRTRIVIPQALEGQRLVFTLAPAEEMLVWINGAEAGSIDRRHRMITLTRSARTGEVYEIIAECYAGHGVRNEGAGPVAWGEEPVPEPPEQQLTIGTSSFGVWNEPLFQAAMDYLTLYSLAQKLPEKSLRAMKVLEGLKKFTYIADFELPEPELTRSVLLADEVLKPLLACKNGSTAPEFTVFGQSHLDLAWLWPVEETIRKAARTYSNQLALMEEYGDYHFLLCEPPILGGDAPVGMEPIFLSQNKNVIVDTTKPADRAENALLVRVYECMGAGTAASFTAAKPIVRIEETDMLEEQPRPLDLDALRHVEFGAFEIKTFLLYLK